MKRNDSAQCLEFRRKADCSGRISLAEYQPGKRNVRSFVIAVFLVLNAAVNFLSAQSSVADSLLKKLKTEQDDTAKVNTLFQLGKYLAFREPDSAMHVVQHALRLSRKAAYTEGEGKAAHLLGNLLLFKGDLAAALQSYLSAMEAWNKLEKETRGDAAVSIQKQKSATIGNIGLVYARLADYPSALDYYFKAEKMYEALKSNTDIAINYGNIGIVYKEEGDTAKARMFYTKALKLSEDLKDSNSIARQLANIAVIFKAEGNFAVALKLDSQALKITQLIGAQRQEAAVMGNIGTLYMEMENYPVAMDFLQQSLQLRRKIGARDLIATALSNIASLHVKQKNYVPARSLFMEALGISDSIHDLQESKFIDESLYALDSIQGNFKAAFDDYKKFVAARDSISNDEQVKKQTRSEMNFEFSKKHDADSIHNAEVKRQDDLKRDEEIRQQKMYAYGGVAGFLLMLVVAGVSFRAYRNKQRANKIIFQQKLIVEEKQKEILDSIHYAKRIQQGLLPREKYIQGSLSKLKKAARGKQDGNKRR